MATPIEIVTQFCDQVAGGDAAKAADFFTADAVYHNIPLDPVIGRDAIRDTIAMFLGMADKVWFDTLHIVADGPIVMTERIDHFTQGDRDITLPVMGTFEVRDGKIAKWRDYFDLNQYMTQLAGSGGQ
jgi:limonene-1,2-epoxide hydrolase